MPRPASQLTRTTLVIAISAIAIAVRRSSPECIVIRPIAERSARQPRCWLSAQTWVELPDSRPYFELELQNQIYHFLVGGTRAADLSMPY
jgi:hypothetical protein